MARSVRMLFSAVMVLVLSGVFGLGAAAQAEPPYVPHSNAGVCGYFDDGSGYSAKIDANGNSRYLTFTAPNGWLFGGYCVKAGSVKQGLGPELVYVAPTKTITISHSSLKSISHYSFYYVRGLPVE